MTKSSCKLVNETEVRSFISDSIGEKYEIKPVTGGLVHSVFKVTCGNKEFYLKVRGRSFVEVPSVVSTPYDIHYEALALGICSKIAPDIFPHVVAEKPEEGLLLITSVMEEDDIMLKNMSEGIFDLDCMKYLGSSLKFVHDSLSVYTEGLRDDNDEAYYINNLLYRFGYHGIGVLNELVDELSAEPRHLILGDLSPKKIGISFRSLRICDLDTAHLGNSIFDVGYFLGHIYLHCLQYKYSISHGIIQFLQGYQSVGFDVINKDLLQKIVLGAMLYRLCNEVIPYQMSMSEFERSSLANEVKVMLWSKDLNWSIIEDRLRWSIRQ